MLSRFLLALSLLSVIIYASNICEKEFKVVPKSKEYIRILKHIEEHHSSCDVVYAYGLFLNNPLMMDELEEDPVFAEEFGHFAKKYPYLAKLIQDKETFEYFNRKYDTDNEDINEAIRYIFRENTTKSNTAIFLMYLQFALDIVGDNYDSKTLKKTIQDLKVKYSPQFLDVVLPLWNTYQKKYRQIPVGKQDYFNNFSKIVDNYGFPLLKKMENYQEEVFPVLLPEKYGNMEYVKTIKSFLSVVMKGKSPEQKIFFLQNSYIDMQIALESGWSKEKIVKFYKPYLKQKFIQHFDNLNQYEKAGIVMLVGDHLDGKLDWMEFDKRSYWMVTNAILKTKNIESTINLLGLYNYASTLFERMKTKQQKEMLVNLVKLPSQNSNVTNNLSLIYALGEHTSYFNAIINKNNKMYDNDKYKEILYVRREGKSILSLFAEGNDGYHEFKTQVDDLVVTPYDEIHDLTLGEKMNYALEAADYASYAMIIVPGVGIAANIGKSLLVNGVKITAKNVAKAGVNEVVTLLRTNKAMMKRVWNKLIAKDLYKSIKSLDKNEIKKLADLSQTVKGTKEVKKYIGRLNLPEAEREKAYMDIIVYQGKLSEKEAAHIFKNLSGVDGFNGTLSKMIGRNINGQKGHLNELRISSKASDNGFEVVGIGKKFNDGLKRADTDIDILLRKNGREYLIEAKDYSATTKMPIDKFKGDLETLNIYAKNHSIGDKPLKFFSFTEKPQSVELLRQYEFWAQKKGVNLIFGTPEEQLTQIVKLSEKITNQKRLERSVVLLNSLKANMEFKNSFVKNFFSKQTYSNQLSIAAQSTKYGEKYFEAVKKASKISSKSLQNLKFSVPKVPIQTLTTRTVQKKFVETLNKTGKYGWQKLQDIGRIMAKYPKSTAASSAYLWYITDPNGFEKALEQSGKTLTEFVLTSMASVGQGAGTVIADKSKRFYDEKVSELTKSIEQKVDRNMSYIVQSIIILLVVILLLLIWHKRNRLQTLLIKKNKQHFDYKENEREY